MKAQAVGLLALLAILFAAGHPASASTPGGRIDARAFQALLGEVADAWNHNDAARAAAVFAEDAVYTEPPDKQVYRGRAELYRFFGGPEGRREWMRMTWRHISFNPEDQVGAGEFTYEWPGGQVHGMASVRVRDGRIANWREYFYASPLAWEAFQGPNVF